ncbi:hypothetical protein [Novosphingobium sp.]|uniref:hypothetical protein n=1 Tax=Novosphingobium sp. TaxID=1874826 RepID=UPI0026372BA5|nr:hypothetical protein [Novosphingobium sp.]
MNWQNWAIAIGAIGSGGVAALFPRARRLRREARRAELSAGAEERFFEEARALDAYPLPRTDIGIRLAGLGMVALGLVLVGLELWSG